MLEPNRLFSLNLNKYIRTIVNSFITLRLHGRLTFFQRRFSLSSCSFIEYFFASCRAFNNSSLVSLSFLYPSDKPPRNLKNRSLEQNIPYSGFYMRYLVFSSLNQYSLAKATITPNIPPITAPITVFKPLLGLDF